MSTIATILVTVIDSWKNTTDARQPPMAVKHDPTNQQVKNDSALENPYQKPHWTMQRSGKRMTKFSTSMNIILLRLFKITKAKLPINVPQYQGMAFILIVDSRGD